ncbi:kinase-like domain-containing protein [Sparassis latifolia]
MVAVTKPVAPARSPPAVGTCIDNSTLELVEILGYGGYGVVSCAVDIFSPDTSQGVPKMIKIEERNAERQRQLHLRKMMLHQLAFTHPNVITLHRVIEDFNYTYLVMDYCPDGDLFTQILHNPQFQARHDREDEHRVLHGQSVSHDRVLLTSAYAESSTECQGGYFALMKAYSSLLNDIWSLSIILLNLITGQNPWKSTSVEDCLF